MYNLIPDSEYLVAPWFIHFIPDSELTFIVWFVVFIMLIFSATALLTFISEYKSVKYIIGFLLVMIYITLSSLLELRDYAFKKETKITTTNEYIGKYNNITCTNDDKCIIKVTEITKTYPYGFGIKEQASIEIEIK